MYSQKTSLLLIGLLSLLGCSDPASKTEVNRSPNVILMMADDMGAECLSVYGSLSYQTPILDTMAARGMLFTKCISQPLCTPSRVKIMTGQYNYRNYEYFGYLNENQKNFGHVMKKAGYKTGVFGKWQLNGLAYDLPGFQDSLRPQKLGFDEFCLWQLTKPRKMGERFANPLLEANGQLLPRDSNAYGPDVIAEYALQFMEDHRDTSFFLYYPMVLVHDPFVPTPASEAWQDPTRRYEKDTAYFRDMMHYTDDIVGRMLNKLKELGIAERTLFIFTADNGTNRSIVTQTKSGPIYGFKGHTTDAGTLVPLIAYWPGTIEAGQVHDGLISFNDFFPTIAAVGGASVSSDGKSFLNLLTGEAYTSQADVFVHYDPRWGEFVNQYRNQFARTAQYKLYQDGKFYNLESDPLEQSPLDTLQLTVVEKQIMHQLRTTIEQAPEWEEKPGK